MTGSLPAHLRIVVVEGAPGDPAESTARALRDAGAEIVYTVLPGFPAGVVDRLAAVVVQEDPSLVVVADAAAAAATVSALAALPDADLDDVPVITADGTPDEVVRRVRETLENAP